MGMSREIGGQEQLKVLPWRSSCSCKRGAGCDRCRCVGEGVIELQIGIVCKS